MARETVRVSGLRELDRAFRKIDKELAKELRDELRQVGDVVTSEAKARFAPIQPRSAEGFRTRVRAGGKVVVEQSRRRTAGLRPDFGVLQMNTALLPALESKESEVVRQLDRMLDRLGDRAGF